MRQKELRTSLKDTHLGCFFIPVPESGTDDTSSRDETKPSKNVKYGNKDGDTSDSKADLLDSESCTLIEDTRVGFAIYELCKNVKLLEENVFMLRTRNNNLEAQLERLGEETDKSKKLFLNFSTHINSILQNAEANFESEYLTREMDSDEDPRRVTNDPSYKPKDSDRYNCSTCGKPIPPASVMCEGCFESQPSGEESKVCERCGEELTTDVCPTCAEKQTLNICNECGEEFVTDICETCALNQNLKKTEPGTCEECGQELPVDICASCLDKQQMEGERRLSCTQCHREIRIRSRCSSCQEKEPPVEEICPTCQKPIEKGTAPKDEMQLCRLCGRIAISGNMCEDCMKSLEVSETGQEDQKAENEICETCKRPLKTDMESQALATCRNCGNALTPASLCTLCKNLEELSPTQVQELPVCKECGNVTENASVCPACRQLTIKEVLHYCKMCGKEKEESICSDCAKSKSLQKCRVCDKPLPSLCPTCGKPKELADKLQDEEESVEVETKKTEFGAVESIQPVDEKTEDLCPTCGRGKDVVDGVGEGDEPRPQTRQVKSAPVTFTMPEPKRSAPEAKPAQENSPGKCKVCDKGLTMPTTCSSCKVTPPKITSESQTCSACGRKGPIAPPAEPQLTSQTSRSGASAKTATSTKTEASTKTSGSAKTSNKTVTSAKTVASSKTSKTTSGNQPTSEEKSYAEPLSELTAMQGRLSTLMNRLKTIEETVNKIQASSEKIETKLDRLEDLTLKNYEKSDELKKLLIKVAKDIEDGDEEGKKETEEEPVEAVEPVEFVEPVEAEAGDESAKEDDVFEEAQEELVGMEPQHTKYEDEQEDEAGVESEIAEAYPGEEEIPSGEQTETTETEGEATTEPDYPGGIIVDAQDEGPIHIELLPPPSIAVAVDPAVPAELENRFNQIENQLKDLKTDNEKLLTEIYNFSEMIKTEILDMKSALPPPPLTPSNAALVPQRTASKHAVPPVAPMEFTISTNTPGGMIVTVRQLGAGQVPSYGPGGSDAQRSEEAAYELFKPDGEEYQDPSYAYRVLPLVVEELRENRAFVEEYYEDEEAESFEDFEESETSSETEDRENNPTLERLYSSLSALKGIVINLKSTNEVLIRRVRRKLETIDEEEEEEDEEDDDDEDDDDDDEEEEEEEESDDLEKWSQSVLEEVDKIVSFDNFKTCGYFRNSTYDVGDRYNGSEREVEVQTELVTDIASGRSISGAGDEGQVLSSQSSAEEMNSAPKVTQTVSEEGITELYASLMSLKAKASYLKKTSKTLGKHINEYLMKVEAQEEPPLEETPSFKDCLEETCSKKTIGEEELSNEKFTTPEESESKLFSTLQVNMIQDAPEETESKNSSISIGNPEKMWNVRFNIDALQNALSVLHVQSKAMENKMRKCLKDEKTDSLIVAAEKDEDSCKVLFLLQNSPAMKSESSVAVDSMDSGILILENDIRLLKENITHLRETNERIEEGIVEYVATLQERTDRDALEEVKLAVLNYESAAGLSVGSSKTGHSEKVSLSGSSNKQSSLETDDEFSTFLSPSTNEEFSVSFEVDRNNLAETKRFEVQRSALNIFGKATTEELMQELEERLFEDTESIFEVLQSQNVLSELGLVFSASETFFEACEPEDRTRTVSCREIISPRSVIEREHGLILETSREYRWNVLPLFGLRVPSNSSVDHPIQIANDILIETLLSVTSRASVIPLPPPGRVAMLTISLPEPRPLDSTELQCPPAIPLVGAIPLPPPPNLPEVFSMMPTSHSVTSSQTLHVVYSEGEHIIWHFNPVERGDLRAGTSTEELHVESKAVHLLSGVLHESALKLICEMEKHVADVKIDDAVRLLPKLEEELEKIFYEDFTGYLNLNRRHTEVFWSAANIIDEPSNGEDQTDEDSNDDRKPDRRGKEDKPGQDDKPGPDQGSPTEEMKKSKDRFEKIVVKLKEMQEIIHTACELHVDTTEVEKELQILSEIIRTNRAQSKSEISAAPQPGTTSEFQTDIEPQPDKAAPQPENAEPLGDDAEPLVDNAEPPTEHARAPPEAGEPLSQPESCKTAPPGSLKEIEEKTRLELKSEYQVLSRPKCAKIGINIKIKVGRAEVEPPKQKGITMEKKEIEVKNKSSAEASDEVKEEVEYEKESDLETETEKESGTERESGVERESGAERESAGEKDSDAVTETEKESETTTGLESSTEAKTEISTSGGLSSMVTITAESKEITTPEEGPDESHEDITSAELAKARQAFRAATDDHSKTETKVEKIYDRVERLLRENNEIMKFVETLLGKSEQRKFDMQCLKERVRSFKSQMDIIFEAIEAKNPRLSAVSRLSAGSGDEGALDLQYKDEKTDSENEKGKYEEEKKDKEKHKNSLIVKLKFITRDSSEESLAETDSFVSVCSEFDTNEEFKRPQSRQESRPRSPNKVKLMLPACTSSSPQLNSRETSVPSSPQESRRPRPNRPLPCPPHQPSSPSPPPSPPPPPPPSPVTSPPEKKRVCFCWDPPAPTKPATCPPKKIPCSKRKPNGTITWEPKSNSNPSPTALERSSDPSKRGSSSAPVQEETPTLVSPDLSSSTTPSLDVGSPTSTSSRQTSSSRKRLSVQFSEPRETISGLMRSLEQLKTKAQEKQKVCATIFGNKQPKGNPARALPTVEGPRLSESNKEEICADITNLRKIGDRSMYISWTQPKGPTACSIVGYEIFVDEVVNQKVRTAKRLEAVLYSVNIKNQMQVKLYGVKEDGQTVLLAKTVYNEQNSDFF